MKNGPNFSKMTEPQYCSNLGLGVWFQISHSLGGGAEPENFGNHCHIPCHSSKQHPRVRGLVGTIVMENFCAF